MSRSVRYCHPAWLALALAWNPAWASDTLEIDWHTLDGGGGRSGAASGLELRGTVGQPDAGPSAGGQLLLVGGFWGGGPPQVLFSDGFESPPSPPQTSEEDNHDNTPDNAPENL